MKYRYSEKKLKIPPDCNPRINQLINQSMETVLCVTSQVNQRRPVLKILVVVIVRFFNPDCGKRTVDNINTPTLR